MTNRSNFTRWSGLASMLGGLLFALGIAIHPLRHGQAVNASPYSAIHVLIAVALMLVLFGLVGLYIHQLEQLGKPGLYSFIAALIGNLWNDGLMIIDGSMMPAIGLHDPAAVHYFSPNVVETLGSSLLFIFFAGLAFFAVGYALFGRVTMRAGVLPPWGGALISIGAVLYVVGGLSLPVLGPESAAVTIIETSGAIPFGLGFIWLGYALWTGSDSVPRAVPRMAH